LSKKKILTSSEIFKWLSRFINFERGQKPKSFRIDRMEALLNIADHPERCAPSIHIAGSKGKGSVTVMLSAMLTHAGFRVARYMSPHVVDIRERICFGDKYFSEQVYTAAGDELCNITEVLLPAASNPLFDSETEDGAEPTYFELLTLLFFLCARNANCDVMVAETGMGGRLDSTNVLDPLVSVINIIELEHTGFLGNTITEIAGEKAGIIKQNKPLILAKQNEEAFDVFMRKIKEKNSPLFYLPDIAELSNVNVTQQGTDFTLSFKNINNFSTLFSDPLSLSINIPGKVQAENAALAIAAAKTAFPNIGEDAVSGALKSLNIPGRFEKISEEPLFIIDGAHTQKSLELCIETFCSLYGEDGILVFGCAADKDEKAMAKIASPHFEKIFITTPGTFKASNPALVFDAFAAKAREKTLLLTGTHEAVITAVQLARRRNLPVLGTGSFYLVSEIRNLIKRARTTNQFN
jgi:dihydrofolate synthase/folylpolyglutamate synthase